MKKIFNIKNIFIFILGGIFFSPILLYAANTINSGNVLFSSANTTATNISDAIDELYGKASYGNAGAGDVLYNKKALVGGKQVTGTMANNGALGGTINPGGSYNIPAGFTTGGTVTANPNQNSGTYTYPAGSTGGTVDMGSNNTYRYVNADNVYDTGKAVYKSYYDGWDNRYNEGRNAVLNNPNAYYYQNNSSLGILYTQAQYDAKPSSGCRTASGGISHTQSINLGFTPKVVVVTNLTTDATVGAKGYETGVWADGTWIKTGYTQSDGSLFTWTNSATTSNNGRYAGIVVSGTTITWNAYASNSTHAFRYYASEC